MNPRRALGRLFVFGLLISALISTSGGPAMAQTGSRPLPPSRAANLLETPQQAQVTRDVLNPELAQAAGRRQVVINLSAGAVSRVPQHSRRSHYAAVVAQQNRLVGRIQAIDPTAKELARLRIALNALIMEVDGAALAAIARDADVTRINPVVNYERDLSETVPYIGATPDVQATGFDGKDVRVAVLDSGVDYMHSKLGGPGTEALYALAYCGDAAATPNPATCTAANAPANPAFFPNDKVVGGYDFVGEAWSGGASSPPLAPDPNPIDFEGHGTHVADIIAGRPFPDPDRARVRAVHASPDAPAVDILVNGAPAFVNVPFQAVSEYATLPPGTYNIKVVPTGAAAPVVIDADVTIAAGKDYTVAATDVLANITPLVLVDDNSAPAAGNAHVRFVHASPDAPAVDVAVAGGPVLFGDYEFGESSPYTPVPAGTYDLEVRLAGTNTVVLPLPGVSLAAGTVYTAFAMGLVGDGSLTAVLSADNATAGGGVAPAAQIYAVKVCSAVSSACSGVALLQGMEFSADPNGDGDPSDKVNIINMSLGANYGQNYFDDLSAAVDNLTALGILTVASAGNSADKPYIVGTPSAARTALSVAQTEVPSARLPILELVGVRDIPAVFQPWSVLPTAAISGPAQYGNGAGGNLLGCNPFPAGSLAGRIVLVDRGVCGFSIKISNIAAAGGTAGIIGLVAPGEPFSGGFGGGVPSIPGFMISQANANLIRANLGATISIDPATWAPLVGTMTGSSSRGPAAGQMFYGNQVMFGQIIKPEIGAPGASISAVAGSGVGTEAFGGTSGAAPVVAGAAALLLNATNWQLSPSELKARLMNTGETTIFNTPEAIGGGLAPITRIGGGEVRIDRAIAARASAWEQVSRSGAISFGFVDAFRSEVSVRRTVVVRNYSNRSITFRIEPTFRFANDATNGAVRPEVQSTITVPANSQRTFPITLRIDSAKLRAWALNSGPAGANGDLLTVLEYDGYLNLIDSSGNANNDLHLAWQVLPRLAGNVSSPTTARVNQPATLNNRGVGVADVTAYSLLGTSPVQAQPGAGSEGEIIDLRYVGYATYEVPAGVCSANPGYLLEFAISNARRQSHANLPGLMSVLLDTDRDGTFDFEVFTFDFGLPTISDGRNLTWVSNLRTGTANAFFFTGHAMESSTFTLLVCNSQLADPGRPAALGGPLAPPAFGQLVDAEFETFNLNSGQVTDSIKNITFAPGGERYLATISTGGIGFGSIPGNSTAQVTISDTGSRTNPTETGVLLLTGNAPDGNEARVITVRR
jgi:minor extracellular serine protease Vpr